MNEKCSMIVFSDKAYNAIIDEAFRKDPIETGGILLGHILDNGYWVVMEVLPPGRKSTHEMAYFEYDEDFVNYLSQSTASKYEKQLSVLGLWHRHPGSMDFFSNTDDETNATFARQNPYGAISGLVNIDPNFRLTMRHVSSPLHYELVDFEVGDDLIPEEYFKLSQYPLKGLHPQPAKPKKVQETVTANKSERKLSPAGMPLSPLTPTKKRNISHWLLPSLAVYAVIVTVCLVLSKCHPVSIEDEVLQKAEKVDSLLRADSLRQADINVLQQSLDSLKTIMLEMQHTEKEDSIIGETDDNT